MHTWKYAIAASLLLTACTIVWARAAVSPSLLSQEEAELLAYLSPYGAAHRRAGLDVRVVAGDSGCLQPGWISLDVISSHAFPPGGGMENHEYVAVNLHTGQVYNPIPIPAEEISTPEMLGAAAIMRTWHHIDRATLDKYRGEQPELKGPPPCKPGGSQ